VSGPRLAGRRALVTGAGSGIGLAIAKLFVEEGADVQACDLDPARGAVVEAHGARFTAVDVRDPGQLHNWITASAEAGGPFDVVVANAGYALVGDALELEIDEWDAHQQVMLRGAWLTFRAALPAMVAAGRGSLIAVASQLSFTAIPRYTSYLAAKAGVVGLVRGVAVDFGHAGIRVNALCPGPTATGFGAAQLSSMTERERARTRARAAELILLGRIGRPEEIAAAALFLASDESSFMTGAALVVDGGYNVR